MRIILLNESCDDGDRASVFAEGDRESSVSINEII